MPEALVYMYLCEMNNRDVTDRMNSILENGGEEALQGLPKDDRSRKLYLKIKTAQLEREKAEGKEILKKFNRELS